MSGTITIDIDELRRLIAEETRKAFREAFDEEYRFRMMELMLAQVPEISEEEQREIEKLYGKPSREVARVLTLEHK
jgi:hypothetical protein